MRTVQIALTLVPLLPLLLTGQGSGPLPPGQVVRWSGPDGWQVGRLTEMAAPDTPLLVRPRNSGSIVTVAWETPGLQYEARKGRKGRGALIGAGLGAGLGIVAGLASGDDECNTGFCILQFSAGEKALLGAFFFAPLGALIGALAAPGTQWAPLTPDAARSRRIAFILAPTRAGIRIGI